MKRMTDATNETEIREPQEHGEAEPLPPFVETPHSEALLRFVQSQNELALNEWTKNPHGATPVLLKRLTLNDFHDTPPAVEPDAIVIVDTEAVLPKQSAIAVGPQIGPAIPHMPGFFYTTPEVAKDAKFVNGYIHTDGQGQRFKLIMQETQNENGTTYVYYWFRFTCPKKAQVR